MITHQLTGFKELAEKLRALPNEMAEKDLMSSVSAAAEVVRKEVIRNADAVLVPRTGTLRRAIYKKRIRADSDGKWRQTYIVGITMGKRFLLRDKSGKAYRDRGGKIIRGSGRDAFYWWWLEFGTSKMSAKKFVRPALPAKRPEAVEAMRARLAKRLAAR